MSSPQNMIPDGATRFLDDLPLFSQKLAEGALSGIHVGRQPGSGFEFSQYRSYLAGDSIARIDWKLFARSDRYFIREADRESELQVNLFIDNSRSMLFETPAQSVGKNRLDYAKMIAACLAWIAQKQGDSVSMSCLCDSPMMHYPARTGEQQWRRICVGLHNLTAQPTISNQTEIYQRLFLKRTPSINIYLTDGYQQNNEFIDLVKAMVSTRNDNRVVLISSHYESNFELPKNSRLRDLETGQMVTFNSHSKTTYRQQLKSAQDKFQSALAELKVSYQRLNVEQAPESALRLLLSSQDNTQSGRGKL